MNTKTKIVFAINLILIIVSVIQTFKKHDDNMKKETEDLILS